MANPATKSITYTITENTLNDFTIGTVCLLWQSVTAKPL